MIMHGKPGLKEKCSGFFLILFTRKNLYLFSLLAVSFMAISLTLQQFEVDECSLSQNKPAVVESVVTFTISCASGQPTPIVAWDFGDGTGLGPYAAQTTITHTYHTTGTFTVFARIQGEDIPLSTVQTIVEPITTPGPTHSSTIAIDTVNNIVWAVNPDNNSVTSINSITLTKIMETSVGTHPRTVAARGNGDVWVANEDDATISIINSTGTVSNTISLPYGSRPYGVCFDPQIANVFVTLSGTGKLLKLNLSGQVIGEASVGATPRGIAVSSDGSRVFVTRFISPADHGEIIEVNPQTMAVVRIIELAFDHTPDFEDKGRGVPNYISSMTISPNGKSAWIPSKKDNVTRGLFRDGVALNFENTVRTITSKIDLQTNLEDFDSRLDINDADMANAVVFSPYGNLAFIALQGNNKIQIRDVQSNAFIANIEDTGLAPQGLIFNNDGSKLFVQNFMSRTVRVYNTEGIVLGHDLNAPVLTTINTVTSELLPSQVLKGKQLFYNAEDTRMSSAGYISCASCHLDGGSDQRVWDFTDRGEGLRNTIPLHGRRGIGIGNVHWTGNFDEIHDFENDIRGFFGGTGFMTNADFSITQDPLGAPKAGRSTDLDALVAYVNSLTQVHKSPYKNADGTFTPEALSGKALFAQLGCGACHAGADYSDRIDGVLHDVGTIQASSGKRINQPLTGFMTPTLKGVWESAPYLHDGSAETLLDVLTTKNASGKHGNTSSLSPTELNQLIAFLNQLDDLNSCTNQSLTLAPVSDKYVNDAPFALMATATSGLPVTYSVLSGPATINGTTVTLTGAGTVIVAANQSGDAIFCSASQVTQSFTVLVECAGVPTGTYKLINRKSGKVLDNNGALTDGAGVMQRTDNASSNTNQQWIISPVGNGNVKLTNKTSSKVLDNAGSTTAGSQLFQTADNAATANNQQWSVCRLSNGAYRLVNVNSNLVLDNGSAATEGSVVIQSVDDASTLASQQWDLVLVTENLTSSGLYKITARHTGKSLDVAAFNTGDNATINQWDYNAGANQKWSVEHVGKGYFTITASHSGKSLQLPTGSLDDNASIFQGANTNNDYQKWIIRDVGNGYYELVAKHSGKTMAVAGGAVNNGAAVVQLGSGGATHQQWKIERLVVGPGPGLGNLQYASTELFKNIWLYTDPTHYGSNVAIMHNGYLITTFTPDSGKPPGGIMVWNVSNPKSPVLVKRVYDERTATLREAHSIGQYGNYIALQDGCGIQLWDFTDVENPVQVKRFCMSGYTHDDYGAAWQLFWQAPYIYISNGSSGFDVVDATDIANPVFVKHVNIGMQAGPIFAIGNMLLTGAHNTGRGYAITDISDPKNPKLLNTVSSGENIYSGFFNGNRMIGSARGNVANSTFSVFDFVDPFNIKFAGSLNIQNSGEQLYCSTQDEFIFQGCQREIVKIDATNPAQMTIAGRGSLSVSGDVDHGQVTPMGNLIFVGNDHGSGNGFIVHQVAPDTKGPEVNMVSPLRGSTNRARTSRIGLTFTDNVDLRTVNNSTFIVRPKGGSALPGIFSHQFSVVNFTPDKPLLSNTTYEIEIPTGGIKDWSGNTISTTFTSYFSTGATITFPPAPPEKITVREEDKRVILSWTSTGQVTKYIIKRGTSATGPFTSIGEVTTTSYTDTNVTNYTDYYYVVAAENSFGEGSVSSVIKAMPAFYLTDLNWVSTTNSWGPVEKDRSNGEAGSTDGRTISLDGEKYSRGLGVHATSEVIYNLNEEYGRFVADVGLDDEVGNGGSCVFQVWLDGVQVFNSGLVTGSSLKQRVNVSVSGVKQLKLIATDGANGNGGDHGSWGGAHLVNGITPGIYEIAARHSGKVMEVAGNAIDNGIRITQATATNNPHQHWKIETAEAGYYKFTVLHSGKVLENNSLIYQTDWTNTNSQKWSIESVGEKYFKITGKQSNTVLEVMGGSFDEGSFIHQSAYSGAIAQQWTFQLATVVIPAAPLNLMATAEDKRVLLSWNSNTEKVARYYVKRGASAAGPFTVIGSVTSTTYTDDNLTNGTAYYYTVSAENVYAEGANAFVQKAVPFALPAVLQRLGIREEDQRIVLSWSKGAESVTGYTVKRSTAVTGPFVTIGNVTGTSYTDNNLNNYVYYYYVVAAKNSFGEGPDSAPVKAMPALYLTDLDWTSATNGLGTVEKDLSNGESAAADGKTISLKGEKYSRGLGVYANAEVIYNLNEAYGRFIADVGIDDESVGGGSCIFQVWLDGVEVFNSGLVTGASEKQRVALSVSGAKELKLITTDAGIVHDSDYASWGGAYLVKGIASGTYEIMARHSGKVMDSGNITDSGMPITQSVSSSSASQHWKVQVAEAGYYKLTSVHSHKVLEAIAQSTDDNASIQQAAWSGANNQKWSIEQVSDAYVKIVNKLSQKVLEISGGGVDPGNHVIQNTFSGAQHQQWTFQAVAVTMSNELKSTASVQIYPNPARKQLHINVPEGIDKTVIVTIINNQGQEVYRSKVRGGSNRVMIESLPSGVYTLLINGNTINTNNRLVIE
jgi:DNA-binding beta-propeller fold protein YncE/fibronectin type 3 domain-containing protein/cytochrome c551/c552